MARKAKAKGALAKLVDEALEVPEELNVLSKGKVREQLDCDIQKFLKKGGKIKAIDPNVTAQPIMKPISNYGSRPI